MHFGNTDPPPPLTIAATFYCVYHPTGVYVLSDSLTADQVAMLNHLEALRHGILASPSVSKQLECAVLLIDVYEAILERHGILIYENQEEVTEH
jgi:hypothetical protein